MSPRILNPKGLPARLSTSPSSLFPNPKIFEPPKEDSSSKRAASSALNSNLTRLNQFVGQAVLKEALRISIEAAVKEKKPPPNLLLTGPYGHGKTTLAQIVARESHCKYRIVDGQDAVNKVTPEDKMVWIIDEIHNLKAEAADTFNTLLDMGNVHIIGCTTYPGALPAPFRSRFRSLYIEEYSAEDIEEILRRASRKRGLKLSKEVVRAIADKGKLNPRVSLAILEFIQDYIVAKNCEVTLSVANDILSVMGIDNRGLTNLDRKYLELLDPAKPVGIAYLSSMLGIDNAAIQNDIEPYLLKKGLISRTPRGRILRENPVD